MKNKHFKLSKNMCKKLVIITNGSVNQGMGHIYRTIALADNCKEIFKIIFLTKSENKILDKIKDNGFEVIRTNNYLKHINKVKPDTIVIDNLDVDENFAKEIKKLEIKLVIFGNSSKANYYADLVINCVLNSSGRNTFYFNKQGSTKYLIGPKYMILNHNVYSSRKSYKYRGNLNKILFSFGGSDPANLSRIVNKLIAFKKNYIITLVLGPLSKYHKDFAKNNKIKILSNVNNLEKLMLVNDLVITSPGGTMFESMFIGCPTISFCQSKSQFKTFKGFPFVYSLKSIKYLDEFINHFYNNYRFYIQKINKLKIGDGKDEVVQKILNL